LTALDRVAKRLYEHIVLQRLRQKLDCKAPIEVENFWPRGRVRDALRFSE
jgi:hypothetical protein